MTLRRPAATLPRAPDALASLLLSTLRSRGRPLTPDMLVDGFAEVGGRRARMRIEETLAILAAAGSVRRAEGGWFAPSRKS